MISKIDMEELELLASRGNWLGVQDRIRTELPPSDALERYDNSPLVVLCSFDQIEPIQTLLNNGWDPNWISDDGRSPLVAALDGVNQRSDMLKILVLLLQHGADPNKITYNNESALHLAIRRRLIPQTELLLQYGADPYLPSREPESGNGFSIARCTKSGKMITLLEKWRR